MVATWHRMCCYFAFLFFWCFIFFLFFFVCPPWVLRNMWMWRRWQAFSLLVFWATCALTKRKRKHQQHISFKKKTFPTNVIAFAIRPRLAIGNKSQTMFHTSWQNWTIYCLTCFFYAFFSLDFRIKWWTIGWIPVYICRWSNVMPD